MKLPAIRISAGRLRLIQGTLALLLFLVSSLQILGARQGLDLEKGVVDSVPYIVMGLDNSLDGSRPLVLIAHGLAGSSTVMEAFSLSLAHAGYVVASWDFDGHGANPRSMSPDIYSPGLLSNIESVLKAVGSLQLADTSALAIVGHSMGSGAALSFGQVHPNTRATVAISPVGTPVTPALPCNLLLMAGSLEPRFVDNARARLAEAGGLGGQMDQGTARKLEIIPGVEHISILFAPRAQALTLDWLNASFGFQPGARPYHDRRLLWFGLALIGTLMAGATLIPRNTSGLTQPMIPFGRRFLALAGGSLMATLLLWLAGLAGLSLNDLLGLRVGGYLMLWFFLAGGAGLLLLRPVIFRPSQSEILSALMIFGVLWLGIGLLGSRVWLPWLLIPQRLMLWPLAILALLPYCLLMGEIGRQGTGSWRFGWWALQSGILCTTLVLAIKLTPVLGFLMLLLPLFPVVLLFLVVPNMQQRGSWTYALSATLFVSWMLLAVFPIQ